MLTANRLEAIMELMSELRGQYQLEIDSKVAEIDRLATRESELLTTIDKQLETITELTGKATDTQKVEQRNRELHNRCEKLLAEMAENKQRMKTPQKDLAAVSEKNKTLTQFDPARTKKNPDTGKKKLAKKTEVAEALQKSLTNSG